MAGWGAGRLFGGAEVDEDTAAEEKIRESVREAIVLLVDVRPWMHEPTAEADAAGGGDGGGEASTPFRNALRIALKLMKQRIIVADNDLIGLMFYGATKVKNQSDYEGVHELMSLDFPSAERIRQLQRVIDGDESWSDEVGFPDEQSASQLANGLRAAGMSLNKSKVKTGDFMSIWLFTNEDDPYKDDDAGRMECIVKAKDLDENNQAVSLYFQPRTGHDFDPAKFFSDMIVEDEAGEGIHNCATFTELDDITRHKAFTKRTLAKLPLQLPGDIKMSISLYNNIYPAKKPSAVQLDARTNKPVKASTNWLCVATGKPLMEHEIKLYHEFGGARVPFTKAEMGQMKRVAKPGLELLGFRDKSFLKDVYNMRPPYFVYPDDSEIRGSTQAFRALLEQMLALDKVAVVRFIPRAASVPRMAALVPQRTISAGDYQAVPPGMFAVPLPYNDDIRPIRVDPLEKANREQTSAARRLVEGFTMPWSGIPDVSNPSLQKFYATLEALAVDADDAGFDEEEDTLKPDPELIEENQDRIDAFAGTLEEPSGLSSAKRKAAGSGGTAKRARKEVSAADTEASLAIVKERFAAGTLGKCTAVQLKDYCRAKGLPLAGKKADLVERVTAHLG